MPICYGAHFNEINTRIVCYDGGNIFQFRELSVGDIKLFEEACKGVKQINRTKGYSSMKIRSLDLNSSRSLYPIGYKIWRFLRCECVPISVRGKFQTVIILIVNLVSALTSAPSPSNNRKYSNWPDCSDRRTSVARRADMKRDKSGGIPWNLFDDLCSVSLLLNDQKYLQIMLRSTSHSSSYSQLFNRCLLIIDTISIDSTIKKRVVIISLAVIVSRHHFWKMLNQRNRNQRLP